MQTRAIEGGAENPALHATRLRARIGLWEMKLRDLPAGDPRRLAIRGAIERLQQELRPVVDCLSEDG